MKKRGVYMGLLKAIIGGLLALIVIIGLTVFVMSFLGLLGPKVDKELISAQQNTELLAGKINSLVADKDPVDYSIMLFSLPSDYAVIGFSKGMVWVGDFCKPEGIQKENVAECKNKACLCLYSGTEQEEDFKGNAKLVKCYELNDVNYILGRSTLRASPKEAHENMGGDSFDINSKYIYPINFGDFLIYGQCQNNRFKTQELYLEQVKDPERNETYVYVTHVGEEPESRRKTRMIFSANKLILKAIADLDEDRFKFLITTYSWILTQNKKDTYNVGLLIKFMDKAFDLSTQKKFNESLEVYDDLLRIANWPEINDTNTKLNYGCRPQEQIGDIYVELKNTTKASELYKDYIDCETDSNKKESAICKLIKICKKPFTTECLDVLKNWGTSKKYYAVSCNTNATALIAQI